MALIDGLVSYYDLGEASGTRVDSHGSNDLTDNNTVASDTGIQGDAADFERTNTEHLSAADSTSLSITGDISLSFWAKLEQLPSTYGANFCLASKAASGTGNWSWLLDVIYNGSPINALRFWYSSNGTFPGTDSDRQITLSSSSFFVSGDVGNWVHVGVTADVSAQSVTFYKNGSAVGDNNGGSTNGTSIADTGTDFQMGACTSINYYYDGLIDEFGMWDRELTSAEITDLYNSGAGRDYAYIAATGGGYRLVPQIAPFAGL